MRTALFVVASLLLASCGLGSGEKGTVDSPRQDAPQPEGAAAPAEAGAAENPQPRLSGVAEESGRQAPGKEADWFFVGRWASSVESCRDEAWVITAESLRTPGHVSCSFDEIESTQRGAAAHATCTAEGPPQHWTLQFSYAQSAQALLIEDGPFADVGLVACAAAP